MLRRIGVRDGDGLVVVRHQHDLAVVAPGDGRDRPRRQRLELALDFFQHSGAQLGRGRHQPSRTVGSVLGLAEHQALIRKPVRATFREPAERRCCSLRLSPLTCYLLPADVVVPPAGFEPAPSAF